MNIELFKILFILFIFQVHALYAQNQAFSSNDKDFKRIEWLKKIADDYILTKDLSDTISLDKFDKQIKKKQITNYSEILFLWGYYNYLKNDNVNSIRFFLKAKETVDSSENKDLSSEIFLQLANSYQRLFYLEKSIFYYQKSLDFRNDFIVKSRTNRIIMNIGNSYFELHDNLLALKYYNQAYENALIQNDSVNIVVGLLNIGNVNLTMKEFDKASKAIDQALVFSRNYNIQKLIGMCHFTRGELKYDTKDFHESEICFNEAVKEFEECNMERVIPEIYKYLVLINYEQKDIPKTFDYCDKFRKEAYKYQVQEKLLRSIKSVNEVLSKLESYPKARTLLYQNIQLLDTVLIKEIAAKKSLTESLNQIAELEKNNRELEQENLVQEERLTTSYIVIALIFIILTIISIALYLFKKAKDKIKNQNILIKSQMKDIEIKNEQARILIQQKEQQTEEILNQNEQLFRYQNRLELLIEERTKELSSALLKVQDSDNLKTYFLQNISHEIRTPLNAISGFSQLLSIDNSNNPEYLEIISQSVNDLLKIIDNILVFSKLQANQIPINKKQFSMLKLLQHLDYETQQICQKYVKKDIRFHVINNLSSDYQLNTDFSFLMIILIQLIENAFKFTENGEICIKCSNDNKWITFFIIDTGIGIKEEKLPYIFESFRKIEGDKKLFRGTGIGLALVNKLVDILNGKLNIQSEFGSGTTISISIPV